MQRPLPFPLQLGAILIGLESRAQGRIFAVSWAKWTRRGSADGMKPPALRYFRAGRILTASLTSLSLAGALACNNDGPRLSKEASADAPLDSQEFETPELGPVAKDGPLVGAVVERAPIHAAAHKKPPVLGYLRAGDKIPQNGR